jgi:isocitrate dehydrogenase kinase/phosphatase
MGLIDQLKAMGIKADAMARVMVDGKPLSESLEKQKKRRAVDDRGMNRTEAAYAELLERMKLDGVVTRWWFESVRLRLAHRTTYTPDFCVLLSSGVTRFVEIKGFLREDAAIKFKFAREAFPQWEFIMLRKVKGGWSQVNI